MVIKGTNVDKNDYITPEVILDEQCKDDMWNLLDRLFPIYRALCGPGFHDSLKIIQETLAIEIQEHPSGSDVEGWTIPKEFTVNEAWVEDETGNRIIDFDDHPYSLWIYSRPFEGTVGLDELKAHLHSLPYLPDAIPLRQTYYKNDWGFCAPHSLVESLTEQKFRVKVDTELRDGFLRIGEFYLPGECADEFLVNSYLCHPLGANDNLSGVVVAVELFRQLSQLPKRHLSYRLAIWPETIGAITYISKNKERLEHMIGGVGLSICGDDTGVKIDETYYCDTPIDRAFKHAMNFCGHSVNTRKFSGFVTASDAGHFNQIGLRIPMVTLTRAGATPQGYIQYHSSDDTPDIVSAENLLETLNVLWTAIHVIERNRTYKGTFMTTPFLTKYGIFPFQHGTGDGAHGNEIARAYFELLYALDGTYDLLSLAERNDLPIFMFDEPLREFLRVGLIEEVSAPGVSAGDIERTRHRRQRGVQLN